MAPPGSNCGANGSRDHECSGAAALRAPSPVLHWMLCPFGARLRLPWRIAPTTPAVLSSILGNWHARTWR